MAKEEANIPRVRNLNAHRLQIEFSESQMKILKELVVSFEVTSYADVVRNGLTILHYIAKAQKNGGNAAIKNADGSYTDIIFL